MDGITYWMKVFGTTAQRKTDTVHHLLCHIPLEYIQSSVGYCFICARFCENLEAVRQRLHTFFVFINGIMSFWNWIKSKISNTATSLAKSKGEGEPYIQLETAGQAQLRPRISFWRDSKGAMTEMNGNLQILKREYERLCLILDCIKKSDVNSNDAILLTLPELPRFSYENSSVKIYIPPNLDLLQTMALIKKNRVEEAKYQHMMKVQEITKRLSMVSDYIGMEDYVKAHDVLEAVGRRINTIDSRDVGFRYAQLSKVLKNKIIEREKLKQYEFIEEQRRVKNEKEEKQKIMDFVLTQNSRRKVGDFIVLRDFCENGIACLYHFTNKANIKSIREKGGLYASAYHSKLGIIAKKSVHPVRSTKNNDVINFSEYVSLSICKEHYMAAELFDAGVDICILKISTEVVGYYNTYFTDRDTSNEELRIGKEFQDTDYINFNAVKDDKLTPHDVNYSQKFAEVLVKAFIPLNLIQNIDNPIKLK